LTRDSLIGRRRAIATAKHREPKIIPTVFPFPHWSRVDDQFHNSIPQAGEMQRVASYNIEVKQICRMCVTQSPALNDSTPMSRRECDWARIIGTSRDSGMRANHRRQHIEYQWRNI